MTDLAHRRPAEPAAPAVDWDAALRYLQLNPRDPKAVALKLVCDRYRLDPLLGHVSLYEGKPYIHFAAYLHIANADSHFDGIECVREWSDDTYYWATVRVHRDDRNFPAERTGKSRKMKKKRDGSIYEDDTADAKAFAQAARRALRMAFNVDAPEPGEDHETPAPEPVVEVARMVSDVGPSCECRHGAGRHAFGASSECADCDCLRYRWRGPTSDPGIPAPPGPGPGSDLTSPSPVGPGMIAGGGDPNPPEDSPEEGDALPDDDEGEGSAGRGEPPAPQTPPGDAVPEGTTGSAGHATTDPTPPPDPSPVLTWCEAHGHDIRLMRIHLKRTYPAEFWDLKDRMDLVELRGDRADKAIAYLEAAFLRDEESSE